MRSFESGIAYALIEAYLCDELALPQIGPDEYQFGACTIRLEALAPRRLSKSVQLPRNRLWLAGDEAAMARFEKQFFLRFLSAGG